LKRKLPHRPTRPGSGNIRCGEGQSQTIPLFPPPPCSGVNKKKLLIRANSRGLEKPGIWTTSSVVCLGRNAARSASDFRTGRANTSLNIETGHNGIPVRELHMQAISHQSLCGRPSCPTHPRTSQHTCGDGSPSHRVVATLGRRSIRPYWCESRVEFQLPVSRPWWVCTVYFGDEDLFGGLMTTLFLQHFCQRLGCPSPNPTCELAKYRLGASA
jgi:hypothetical protein